MADTLTRKNFVVSQGDIDRVLICPASRAYVGPKLPTHPGMWWGIFVHRFLQYAKERGRAPALAYIRSKRKPPLTAMCERIDIDAIPDGIHEAGVVIDPAERTGEIAPYNTAEIAQHIFARLDLLYYDETRGDIPHVADFKSGERSYDPATSTQLLTEACGIAYACNASEVAVSVINVIKDGTLRWNTHLHKASAMGAHWDKMHYAHLSVMETRREIDEDGIAAEFVHGSHCSGCRAEVACLHKRANVKQ